MDYLSGHGYRPFSFVLRLPPCMATIAAIVLIGTVSLPMAAGLILIAGAMGIAMFHLAAAGKPLHDEFADKAAAVDGEMVDAINNMSLVRAFCGLSFEHDAGQRIRGGEALSQLMRGRAVIAIAHRLATLRNFDRVVVLKAGKIIEDGPPDRLMQGRGPYRELVMQEMSWLAQHAA